MDRVIGSDFHVNLVFDIIEVFEELGAFLIAAIVDEDFLGLQGAQKQAQQNDANHLKFQIFIGLQNHTNI